MILTYLENYRQNCPANSCSHILKDAILFSPIWSRREGGGGGGGFNHAACFLLMTFFKITGRFGLLWLLAKFDCATFGVNIVSLTWGMFPWQPFCQTRATIITLTQTIVCFSLSCINWLVLLIVPLGKGVS